MVVIEPDTFWIACRLMR